MSDAFPSSQRRGGCAERSEGADGVVSSAKRFAELLLRLRRIGLALRATPVRQLLLSCRATPPLRGGECCSTSSTANG